MKLTLITVLCCILLAGSNVYSQQLKYGATVNVGTSWIRSGNLKDNLEFQLKGDRDIKEWDVNSAPGILIGLGGTAVYAFNEIISVQGELSYNYQQSSFNIDFFEDARDATGTGATKAIASKAKISSSRIAVPLTLNYSLGANKPIISAGLELNFLSTPKIDSNEKETEIDYTNNTKTAQNFDSKAVSSDINLFKTSRLNFLFGAGKTVNFGGKKISIQMKYHLPLTSSVLYTSNIFYDDQTFKNNEVFGASGKIDAEQDAPGFPLNDYKMSFIDFNLSYFFNN